MSYDFASAVGLRDAEIAEVERLRTENEHLIYEKGCIILGLNERNAELLAALQALVTTIYARPDMQSLLGFTEIEQVKAARAAIEKAEGHE